MIPTVGVVLVNYNGLADTRECLRSLARIDYPRWFPVVVDNASRDDPTENIATEFPGCAVIRRSSNGGWAGGNNTGIDDCLARHADFVILLNNDTRVDPALISRLVKAAEHHRGYGILGPIIRDFDLPRDIQTEGCTFNRPDRPGLFQRREVALKESDVPAVVEVDIVNGCCLMASAAVFRRAGRVDERFFLIHEESDLCLRTRRAGLRCGVIAEALVWHKGSQSFRRSGFSAQRYYDVRNLLLLIIKHAFLPVPQRSRMHTVVEYLRYAYARWEQQANAGCHDAADAVLEGVHDALLRHFGPHRRRSRMGLGLLRRLFEWRRGRVA